MTNLRCENKIRPIGVESIRPKFSWELQSTGKNVQQTAYRILVSDDSSLLLKNIGNIWDSKKVISNTSIQVNYRGKQLLAGKQYFWKAMVWDNKSALSSWSENLSWQMGLLKTSDWKNARWICYEEILDSMIIAPHMHQGGKKAWGIRKNVLPVFRKEFNISKQIKQATAFISGLGHFELNINGKKAGDHFLDPGWTDYGKHALYVSFDITQQLKKGSNAIGVSLGNGFYYIPGQRYRKMTGAYGLPKMILLTHIEYTDGSSENIVSDESWKTAPSPIFFSSIFGGEDYDANLYQTGWDGPGFNDQNWKKVVITKGPSTLNSQITEPVKLMQEFLPQKTTKLNNGAIVYDLAQNFSGIPSITVDGRKGDTIRIYPAELLNDDGSVNQKASGSIYSFTYILKGEGDETWQPQFTYYGFRYLEVRFFPADSARAIPVIKKVSGWHIRNATASIGEFECSNDLFNRTYKLVDWAIKSNMVSLFTDCPHREKLGWLEQTYLMGSSVHYAYDIALLNRKMISDMKNAQYPDGKIPEIVPEFTGFTEPFDESPEWGSAAIILPWYNYLWYGDKETLSTSYEMMKKYASYLRTKARDHILTHGLGDWYDQGPNRPGFSQLTKAGITATATYYYDLTILTEIASLLNKSADKKQFEQEAKEIKQAFNLKFFDTQKIKYDSASQTANAMALYMGLTETSNRDAVLQALILDLQSRNNALTAGDIGYRYVLQALNEAGRGDIIYMMNNRDDVPGYGYQLKNGATALTESWQGLTVVSNNHFMLGHLMEWFYSGLAGIRQKKGSVAYKQIEIKPQPVGDISYVNSVFQSPYGEIKSSWTRSGNSFVLDVTIPVNTTAEIYLPGSVKPIKTGSGSFQFQTTIK